MNIKTFEKAYKQMTGKNLPEVLVAQKIDLSYYMIHNTDFNYIQIGHEFYADIKCTKEIWKFILN